MGAQPGKSPFDEFRRAEQSIDEAELSVEALHEMQEVLSPRPELESEFAKLERDSTAGTLTTTVKPDTSPLEASQGTGKRRVRIE